MRKTLSLIKAALVVVPVLLLLSSFPSVSAQGKPSGQEKPAAPAKTGVAGTETCEACHEPILKDLGKTVMGRLFLKHPRNSQEQMGCEACHGPGEAHAESGGAEFGELIRFLKGTPVPVQKRNEACIQCHQKGKQLFWEGSSHQMRDLACTKCHKVHSEIGYIPNRTLLTQPRAIDVCSECHKQQAAQQMRFSHHPLREGKLDCTSCHNPHGTVSAKLLKANSTNELCYSCHMEKRGPLLFEHIPVMEDCSNCHTSHGSNYNRLLKVPVLRLCRQCHVNVHFGQGVNAAGLSPGHIVGRLCTDCHFNIHGSNHPTDRGRLFLR